MVWNVLRKDFDMRHDEYIKTMYRIDSVKKRMDNTTQLLSQLVEEDEYSPTHYAAHKETGIMYDKRILADRLAEYNKEIDELEEKLSE